VNDRRSKKLGLLLFPLVPLSALGIVDLIDRALPTEPAILECRSLEHPPPAPQPAPPLAVTAT